MSRKKLSKFGSSDPIDSQARITILVTEYEQVFKAEYDAFLIGMRQKKALQDNAFAETGMDVAERLLFEVPATLHSMFSSRLSIEDMEYFNSKKGARWFAKTFPQYRVSEKV